MSKTRFDEDYGMALLRAAISGLVSAGATFFASIANHQEPLAAAVAAGVAFFGVLVARGFGGSACLRSRRGADEQR